MSKNSLRDTAGIEQKKCTKCGQIKPITLFPTNNWRGYRSSRCYVCKHELKKVWSSTPRGRAVRMWDSMLRRVGKESAYLHVRIEIEREEFVAWATQAIAAWLTANPGRRPSLDRIKPEGHYRLDNIRILELGENSRRRRGNRFINAPPGTSWCADHKEYLPASQFQRNARAPSRCYYICKQCAAKRYRDKVSLRSGSKASN